MIDAKSLKRAVKCFEEIKAIDAEIGKIRRLGELIGNRKTHIDMCLVVEDLEPEAKPENILDDDRSIKPEYTNPASGDDRYNAIINGLDDILYNTSEWLTFDDLGRKRSIKNPIKKPKNTTEYANSVSDSVALRVLAVVLQELTSEREAIVNRLQKLGVTA